MAEEEVEVNIREEVEATFQQQQQQQQHHLNSRLRYMGAGKGIVITVNSLVYSYGVFSTPFSLLVRHSHYRYVRHAVCPVCMSLL